MESVLFALFSLLLIFLNMIAFTYFTKRKLHLIISGIVMLLLAPVIGFSSGALFLHFYADSAAGTSEGAAYGGAFFGLLAAANGMLLVMAGIMHSIWTYCRNVRKTKSF